MAGVPVYAPEPGLRRFHRPSRQPPTVHGILKNPKARHGQAVEIPVVVQRHTVPVLPSLAGFVRAEPPRSKPGSADGPGDDRPGPPDFTAGMGRPTGYRRELAETVGILDTAGITTRIYNHQLYVLDRRLWPYAVRSISDWKNDYLDICCSCSVRDAVGRRLHHKRQPPQPAPAPGTLISPLPRAARISGRGESHSQSSRKTHLRRRELVQAGTRTRREGPSLSDRDPTEKPTTKAPASLTWQTLAGSPRREPVTRAFCTGKRGVNPELERVERDRPGT